MKTSTTTVCLLVVLGIGARAADFINLDFESARPPSIIGSVPVTNAFPGWHVYAGDVELTEVYYNAYALTLGSVSLLSFGGPATPDPIQGSFTAYVYSGLVLRVGQPYAPGPVSLAQTGVVPADTRSLQFQGYDDLLQVSLGGNSLSLVPLSTGSNHILYGADITPFAGQELELRFTAPIDPNRIFPYRTDSLLDSIQFSTTPVPEPSTFVLFTMAAVFGWFYWRRKRR